MMKGKERKALDMNVYEIRQTKNSYIRLIERREAILKKQVVAGMRNLRLLEETRDIPNEKTRVHQTCIILLQ